MFLLRKHNKEEHDRDDELMCRACDTSFKSKAARDSHRYHIHGDEVRGGVSVTNSASGGKGVAEFVTLQTLLVGGGV